MQREFPRNYYDFPERELLGSGEFLDPPMLSIPEFPGYIMSHPLLEKHYGAYLPHYTIPNSLCYCTIRIKGSFPEKVITVLANYYNHWKNRLQNKHKQQLYRYFAEIEHHLDEGVGSYKIDSDDCLNAIHKILWEDNGHSYFFHAFSIMCNHIHLMLQILEGNTLEAVMPNIKHKLSSALNNLLGRTGESCFQEDYFNRIVRYRWDYYRYEDYIWNNPGDNTNPLSHWSLLRCKPPAQMANHWPVSSKGVIVGYEKYYQRFYPVYKGQTPARKHNIGCFC